MFDKNQIDLLMKQAKEMQQTVERAQEKSSRLEIEGESGAGLVKIIMTGKRDITKVSISDAAMDDKEMLEDLIAAAVNNANRKIDTQNNAAMGQIANIANIGNLLDNFKST